MRCLLPSLLLAACASGTVDAPDDGTETAAPTDVGTASPCGEGAPAGCERVGSTCMSSTFPPSPVTDWHFTDEDIRIRMLGGPTCGYFGVTACEDARFIAYTSVSENSVIYNGMLVQQDNEEGPGYVGVLVLDAATRERVASGVFDAFLDVGRCSRWLYGERDAFSCLEAAYQRAVQTMPSCMADVTCDYCACRVNEVTDATSPDCVQP